MPRLTLPTVAVALVLAASTEAADKVTDSDRFQLWNACRPMGLVVEKLSEDATAIGLTREAVSVAVRSRLRAARMYRAGGGVPFLGARVAVVGSAFDILVNYAKWLNDPVSGVSRGATTWSTGSTGTHGRNVSYILSSVSQHVDKFIDEYLG